MNQPPRWLRRLSGWPAATVLLLAFALLAWSSAQRKSVTFDEVAHLTAGASYWFHDDYRLHPENGNWPQRLVALPAWLGNSTFPDLDQPAWQRSEVYEIGDQFFFTAGNDIDALIRRGRALMILVGVALGAVIYVLGRQLFGAAGGIVSLTAYSFNPHMLAHTRLMTSDLMATLFFLLAVWGVWRLLERVTGVRLLWSLLAVSGLLLSKMSAVLLLPMALLLVLLRPWRGAPWILEVGRWRHDAGTKSAVTVALLALVLLHAAVGWAMIWSSYGWHYSATTAGLTGQEHFEAGVSNLLEGAGVLGSAVSFAQRHHLLPEAYLYGFSFAVNQSARRLAFLAGERSLEGWSSFFPYAFAVKTSEALLLLLLVAGGLTALQAKRSGAVGKTLLRGFRKTAPLWILMAVYGWFAWRSHLNIGHRHLLPLYPPLFLLAGAAGDRWASARLLRRALRAGCLAFVVWTGLSIWPDYLAYFNRLSGGPSNGYRHLVDSSLDWGQDLPALTKYIKLMKMTGGFGGAYYLSYFGTARPEHYFGAARFKNYGFDVHRLPGFFDQGRAPVVLPLEWGTYCISASMLQLYGAVGTSAWGPGEEAAYQELRTRLEPAIRRDGGLAYGHPDIERYDRLRLARLLEALRQREPDRILGYSILIYNLSPTDLQSALGETSG